MISKSMCQCRELVVGASWSFNYLIISKFNIEHSVASRKCFLFLQGLVYYKMLAVLCKFKYVIENSLQSRTKFNNIRQISININPVLAQTSLFYQLFTSPVAPLCSAKFFYNDLNPRYCQKDSNFV